MDLFIVTELSILLNIYKIPTVELFTNIAYKCMIWDISHTKLLYGFWLCADQRYDKDIEPQMAKLTPLLIKIMKYGILMLLLNGYLDEIINCVYISNIYYKWLICMKIWHKHVKNYLKSFWTYVVAKTLDRRFGLMWNSKIITCCFCLFKGKTCISVMTTLFMTSLWGNPFNNDVITTGMRSAGNDSLTYQSFRHT